MIDLKDIVSKNIIYLRTNNKMTQLELGEAISYSDKAVSKWERGEAVPDAYVLKEMSDLFHVSVDYLLTEHSSEELKQVPLRGLDIRDTISLISLLGTWTLGIIVFIVFWLIGSFNWLILVYTLPISLVVMVVLTAIWGKRKVNILNVSLLVWILIASIYLTFLEHNWWFLFIVGVPAQLIVLLSFSLKRKK